MQHSDQWVPTKFIKQEQQFRPSANPRDLAPGSRFIAGIQIGFYQRAIEAHARGRLLDMGCGKVPLYEIYRDRVDETVCIDWPQSFTTNTFVDLFVDLNGPIPLDGASFDTILLTDVLEHIAEPSFLLNEIRRLLRSGGTAIITVPFLYWLHEQPHDYYRYTEHALRRLCSVNGLDVLSLDAHGGAPAVVLDITAKVCAASPLLSRLHLALANALMTLPAVRRYATRTATLFPLGYCLVARKP